MDTVHPTCSSDVNAFMFTWWGNSGWLGGMWNAWHWTPDYALTCVTQAVCMLRAFCCACPAGSAVMVVNAITTSGARVLPEIGLLSSVLRFVQGVLDIAGVDTPDALFNLLSQVAANPPGLAAAPYVNALRNTSVSMHIACCCRGKSTLLCLCFTHIIACPCPCSLSVVLQSLSSCVFIWV